MPTPAVQVVSHLVELKEQDTAAADMALADTEAEGTAVPLRHHGRLEVMRHTGVVEVLEGMEQGVVDMERMEGVMARVRRLCQRKPIRMRRC